MNDRLRKAIGTYCLQMDDEIIDSLTRVVQRGALDWFPEEFAAAIRAGEFTPRGWEDLTDVMMDDDDGELLEEYLRLVWSRAAPHQPYPLDV
jgi:hypothetical protein